jgi:hypothetical protein
LGYDVIRPVREILFRYDFDLQTEIEIRKVFEWNCRHSRHILLSWNFYHLSILIVLVKILD